MKKQSVQYYSHFSIHGMQAMAICSRNGLVAITAEYQECLKAGPFDVHYQCISAWFHCDCSTKMRCVDTFCCHLSLIYLYREDAWNVPVSLFFLNMVISLSLNDSAHNTLNDVLKTMLMWSCWKLALQ